MQSFDPNTGMCGVYQSLGWDNVMAECVSTANASVVFYFGATFVAMDSFPRPRISVGFERDIFYTL